ncbi:MAG TPA: hypothetical protein VI461_13720 [Chitinophagaceae bacterium]|nr:hypothetical protein [Chitinophagaceae bacterium]
MSVNVPVDELAQHIFKKTLQECSEAELQQLVKDYPYFGPAQLLLTKKLQNEDSSLLEDQVQTTSLYFPNRLWLQYLMNGNGITTMAINHQTTDTKKTQTENTEPGLVNAMPVINENKEATAMPGEDNDENAGSANASLEMRSLKIEPLTDTAIIFEPYHTVDYFASQGIKFREEDKPGDHFSQQLKSFTEWLKTMKRIPAAETNIVTDAATEKKVEQLAEHSLAERHVVTEAMAEVWTKQGNRSKAEEIYRKLSLLDPSKSSYFAAKIEDLKKTS